MRVREEGRLDECVSELEERREVIYGRNGCGSFEHSESRERLKEDGVLDIGVDSQYFAGRRKVWDGVQVYVTCDSKILKSGEVREG